MDRLVSEVSPGLLERERELGALAAVLAGLDDSGGKVVLIRG
jgi:hypothetical protein